MIHEAESSGKHVTGLLFYNPEMKTADEQLGLTETPLVDLDEAQLRPSEAALAELNASFRA